MAKMQMADKLKKAASLAERINAAMLEAADLFEELDGLLLTPTADSQGRRADRGLVRLAVRVERRVDEGLLNALEEHQTLRSALRESAT